MRWSWNALVWGSRRTWKGLEVLAKIAPLLTAIVIGGSAYAAFQQLVHIRKSHEANLWTQISSQWQTREMGDALWRLRSLEFETLEDFESRYTLNSQAWQDRRLIMNYFEFVGALTRRGYLDEGLVLDYFKELPGLYGRLETFVDGYRKRFSNPHYMEGFEWLYHKWKRWSYREGWGPGAEAAWGKKVAHSSKAGGERNIADGGRPVIDETAQTPLQ